MTTHNPDTPTHQQLPDFLPQSAPNGSNNRRVVAGGLVVLVALIGLTSYVAFKTSGAFQGGSTTAVAPAAIAPAVVNITKTGFVPATVSVKVGQAVAWTNTDSEPHFVTSNDPKPLDNTAPDPASEQPLSQRDSYSYVFNKAGSYGYHDNKSGLTGTVVVK